MPPGRKRARCFAKAHIWIAFPVLGFQPEQISHYQLRRSKRDDHFCTSEVAALCLELSTDARDVHAGQVLERYLEVYTHHYLRAKHQLPPEWNGDAHQALGTALQPS